MNEQRRRSDESIAQPTASRRKFIRSAVSSVAAVGSLTIVPRHVLGGAGFVAPSDMIQIGLIGCGGRARQNMQGIMRHADAQIVAVADPAERWDTRDLRIYRTLAGRKVVKEEVERHYTASRPDYRCAEYEDFRVMLEQEAGIDAVVISTPDHQHAHNCLHAMRAGKHVYCEKPLTHNIREARLVAEVAAQSGVATQLGNQGHSRDSMARTVEAIRGGLIGDVRQVHAWVPASRWNPSLLEPPREGQPAPSGLNWDLWLGPREARPFHPAYAPVHWRDFWDFGCGALGDFACHDLDSATWALDLQSPQKIDASNAGQTHPELAPHGSWCRFEFPRSDSTEPLEIHWYDGGLMPELPPQAEQKVEQYRRGVLFIGDKGWMLCHGAGGEPWIVTNDGTTISSDAPQIIPRVADHYRDWLDACKGGRPALSNFQYGARLTEITLLGVLAVRLAKPIVWNHESMQADGLAEADEIIRGTYRDGWSVDS